MRQVDLRTAYAHIGIHPGDVGPQEAQIIFNEAMAIKGFHSSNFEGGVFVEINPAAGRGTAILGIAVKNLGAKLCVVDHWQTKNPQEARWFDLAVMLHQLQDIVVRCEATPEAFKEIINGAGIDLVLVNGEFESLLSLPLKEGATIIKRRSAVGVENADCVADHRPAISVWKMRPSVVEVEEAQIVGEEH